MTDWVPIVGAALGAGGVSGIAGSLLTGLLARPKVKADAVLALTDAAVKQVNELQEEVSAARKETVAARKETAAARRETAAAREETAAARQETEAARTEVRLLTAEVDACLRTMRAWRAAIFSPAATVDGLRAMVGTEHGTNGGSS